MCVPGAASVYNTFCPSSMGFFYLVLLPCWRVGSDIELSYSLGVDGNERTNDSSSVALIF